ncbi:MAG: glycosyltransferase family 4 protein, partial [Deltaproteobacteria bacterium]
MPRPPRPLRVALDLRMVGRQPHGIARYAKALWEGLPPEPGVELVALTGPETEAASVRPGDRIVRCRAPFLSAAEQLELPLVLARHRVELLHATSFSVPAAWRGPLVLTLHDLNHLANPGWYGPGRLFYYERLVGPAARRAVRLLTVSRFSAGEISRRLDVAQAAIVTAPIAIEAGFVPQTPERLAAVRARLGLPERYVLFLGNGKPHKNVALLVSALGRCRVPVPALLCGQGVTAAVGRLPPGARTLERVQDDELPALYGGALAFAFPSRYEGFGLPPLEAAACGTPVLVARGTAMDEIWEGVVPLLSPDDP